MAGLFRDSPHMLLLSFTAQAPTRVHVLFGQRSHLFHATVFPALVSEK